MKKKTMKWLSFKWTLIFLVFGLFKMNPGLCQDDGSPETEETYFKKHSAFTDFSRLGVNQKQFAKCVKNVNYLEEEKTLNVVFFGKTEYKDDGKNYDVVANDGILTSSELFFYGDRETVLPPGEYLRSNEDYIVYDDLFEHMGSERLPPLIKVRVKCKNRWVHCSEMPNPFSQICYEMGPPFGSFVFECVLELSF